MSRQARTALNVLIIAAIAAAVDFLPQGGQVAAFAGAVLSLLFAAGVCLFAVRIYQERRLAIYSLGERMRSLLYGAIVVAVVTLTATTRMLNTTAGLAAWFALLAGVVYVLALVYRHSRSY
jgi:hypothetical protein